MSKPTVLGVTLDELGAHFGVWAPFADGVSITGDFTNWSSDGLPLEKQTDGTWSTYIQDASAGQQYKYLIKHGKRILERNDPRALQLTAALDASIIVESEFDWQNDTFTMPLPNDQVIYELHIGTFNRPDPATPGTFESAAQKLDYLRDLGINIIEVMPISGTNMERWWGYEPTYLYSVDAAYGGRQAFKAFVREAHKRGMAVIIDVVYNHLWPKDTFGLWKFDGWSQHGHGGIYFYNDWRADTPWGPRPDYGRPEVRAYIVDSARTWMQDCHVDGFRADSTHSIRNARSWDQDPSHDIPEGWLLLEEFTKAVHAINPLAITFAEDAVFNEQITRPIKQAGLGFDAQWDTTIPALLRHTLDPIEDKDRFIAPVEEKIKCIQNGDAFQRVIYSESHDAVANGQARMNAEITPVEQDDIFARRRSMLAASIALTAPGRPMLFQGQEFMEHGSFTHWSQLDWAKAETFHGVVQYYRDLITLRRNLREQTAGLKGQGYETLHCNEDTKMLAYHRFDATGAADSTVVILNFANTTHLNYELPFPASGAWKVRLNSDWQGYSSDFTNIHTEDVYVDATTGIITIAPYSVIILSQD